MNCFQIINSVLNDAYREIQGTEEEKDCLIKEAFQYLSDEYVNLSISTGINYNDPITRFAYIYKYVTSHANLVNTIIKGSQTLVDVFEKDKLNIACIGGGPGSDFLGILKYLMINDKKPLIRFQLCDKEKTWIESWSDVDDKIDPEFRISTHYLPLDVTDPTDWKDLT